MDLGAISARKGAPVDGTDPFTNSSGNGFYRSKQNSDAFGMLYHWGRKDPFAFATSSLKNGSATYEYGKYPVKIYNSKSELIYQMDNGGDNMDKSPTGGVRVQIETPALSITEIINKPNMFYYTNGVVVNQIGQTRELFDYYWTSYSRGMDGKTDWSVQENVKPHWHNTYLDGYIALRSKSIYDPCPYGYRTPTNGTYKDFN